MIQLPCFEWTVICLFSFNRIDIPPMKAMKVIWKAASSHRRSVWICCGMTISGDLPRTLFIAWGTDSLLSAEFQGMLKYRKMPPPFKKFLGHCEGKDNLKFFSRKKRGLYALPWGHIQLLFKINILNLKECFDFSYISRVRQYSTLKDYYYFYKKVIYSNHFTVSSLSNIKTTNWSVQVTFIWIHDFEQLLYLLFVKNKIK